MLILLLGFISFVDTDDHSKPIILRIKKNTARGWARIATTASYPRTDSYSAILIDETESLPGCHPYTMPVALVHVPMRRLGVHVLQLRPMKSCP